MTCSLYPDGLGGTVDIVATDAPFYGLDAVAWYVHFPTGVDAVAPAGRDKQRPLKTLLQAVTNASENDVIVLLDGHSETISSLVVLNKQGLVVVGCGQTAGVPNVLIRGDSTSNPLINVTAESVQLRNIRFGENVNLLPSFDRIVVGFPASGFVMDGCYVEVGENTRSALSLAANFTTIRDSTFISTATSMSARPVSAITSLSAIGGLRMEGVVLSDGVVGFGGQYGINLTAGACINLSCERLSLLLGASMKLHADSTGYIIPSVVTGGGVIDV